MNDSFFFHPGERSAQERAGESAIAMRNRAIVANFVVAGARPFIAQQFMVVVGNVDASGKVWASVLYGQPGFAQTLDGRSIHLTLAAQARDPMDPIWSGVAPGNDLAMLFIELGTRRRYRVNGTVLRVDDEGIEMAVHEAFPNCPKYIQRRELRGFADVAAAPQAASGRVLRGSVRDVVDAADTLFIASQHAEHGADVSHRGGDAGFVRVVDEATLRIPDFVGNSLFNTLGNLGVDPRAGLAIPDFAGGRLLQLTGRASVRWDGPDAANETGGTGRFLEFHVDRWVLRDAMPRAQWEYLDASPYNPHSSAP
ncbi:pyridoxamine 5'-phosphate oxidase family protein [Luteibacter sp. 329MFSha]|uniref:pyridoxamine 5'-phosphate oxidase family protein n=1 Tax=Luteibacter sp. 329MFSha TaxID=1798239 RepID=UPI0008C21067|nr:pyridoxamine 5'-phosphate oxidase family protein [Luteibacter sp. 329MFSha]SEW25317.1 hypothetical protein SAMN04515660_3386 [Luteibacter sp. 329MFSha]